LPLYHPVCNDRNSGTLQGMDRVNICGVCLGPAFVMANIVVPGRDVIALHPEIADLEIPQQGPVPRTIAYLRNGKSGRIALKLPARSFVDEEGAFLKRVALQRPTRCEHMLASDLGESAWETTNVATFDRLWAEEVEAALAALDTETIQLATGLLLPIWSALPSDHLTVNRIADNDGHSWLGRLVFDADVVKLFTKLGIEQADNLPADKIAAAALRGEPVTLVRPFDMTLARRRVNGELRLELSGAPADRLTWLKSLGCFTEIIQYRTRVFVPRDTAEVVIAALVAT
jgi:hypothetical protein